MKVENRSYKEYKNWDNLRKTLSVLHSIYKKISGKKIRLYS